MFADDTGSVVRIGGGTVEKCVSALKVSRGKEGQHFRATEWTRGEDRGWI